MKPKPEEPGFSIKSDFWVRVKSSIRIRTLLTSDADEQIDFSKYWFSQLNMSIIILPI